MPKEKTILTHKQLTGPWHEWVKALEAYMPRDPEENPKENTDDVLADFVRGWVEIEKNYPLEPGFESRHARMWYYAGFLKGRGLPISVPYFRVDDHPGWQNAEVDRTWFDLEKVRNDDEAADHLHILLMDAGNRRATARLVDALDELGEGTLAVGLRYMMLNNRVPQFLHTSAKFAWHIPVPRDSYLRHAEPRSILERRCFTSTALTPAHAARAAAAAFDRSEVEKNKFPNSSRVTVDSYLDAIAFVAATLRAANTSTRTGMEWDQTA